MGHWVKDNYYYSRGELVAIANNYQDVYMSIYYKGGEAHYGVVTNPLIDYKIDFDRALNVIGRGHWTGWDIEERDFFRDYRWFGKLQRVIIATIYGVFDYELEEEGFYSVPRLRNLAYGEMVTFLNGKPLKNSKQRK